MFKSIFKQLFGASLLFHASAVNPWDASISFYIIWTFVSHFYFWQSGAGGLVMHCWFWHVEMVSTSLSPAVRFFYSLKCDLPCDWFTPPISQIMVHFRPLMHQILCLRAFLNTARHPPFCHTHNIQLINNGRAANNRIPELQCFRMDCRWIIRCRMHAIIAKNMPASKTFNIQFQCSAAEGCLQGAWISLRRCEQLLMERFYFFFKAHNHATGHKGNFLCWAFSVSSVTVGYNCVNLLDSIMFAQLDCNFTPVVFGGLSQVSLVNSETHIPELSLCVMAHFLFNRLCVIFSMCFKPSKIV